MLRKFIIGRMACTTTQRSHNHVGRMIRGASRDRHCRLHKCQEIALSSLNRFLPTLRLSTFDHRQHLTTHRSLTLSLPLKVDCCFLDRSKLQARYRQEEESVAFHPEFTTFHDLTSTLTHLLARAPCQTFTPITSSLLTAAPPARHLQLSLTGRRSPCTIFACQHTLAAHRSTSSSALPTAAPARFLSPHKHPPR